MDLENIVLRLDCCAALLRVLHAALVDGNGDVCDALAGAGDLLRSIICDLDSSAGREETTPEPNGKLSSTLEMLAGAGEREIDLTWRFVRGLTRRHTA